MTLPLQEHAKLRVFVDQTFLVEVTSIDFQTDAGNQRVDTMEGLAGFSPGAGSCSITLNLAVPISGQEYGFQQLCAKRALVSMQIPIGQEGSYSGNGKIMTTGISGSVNANVEQTVNWEGELNEIK